MLSRETIGQLCWYDPSYLFRQLTQASVHYENPSFYERIIDEQTLIWMMFFVCGAFVKSTWEENNLDIELKSVSNFRLLVLLFFFFSFFFFDLFIPIDSSSNSLRNEQFHFFLFCAIFPEQWNRDLSLMIMIFQIHWLNAVRKECAQERERGRNVASSSSPVIVNRFRRQTI